MQCCFFHVHNHLRAVLLFSRPKQLAYSIALVPGITTSVQYCMLDKTHLDFLSKAYPTLTTRKETSQWWCFGPPIPCILACGGLALLCARAVGTKKTCWLCVSDWSRLAYRPPGVFLEKRLQKRPQKHATEPRDCPCRNRAPQRKGRDSG